MVGSRLIAFRFEVEMKNGEGDLNFQSMGGEVLRNVVICSLPSCFFLVRPTFVPTGTFIRRIHAQLLACRSRWI